MRDDSAKFGELLIKKGFMYAPANEAGVVCLFGAMAWELGFLIERMRRQFPDCEAKRLVHNSLTEWERCIIEFEYKSRNFEKHGHDPSKVDLIVCWRNNWPGAPVDVLELAGVVKGATDESWRLGVLMGRGYHLTRATRERQERELASGRKQRGEERKERAKSEGR